MISLNVGLLVGSEFMHEFAKSCSIHCPMSRISILKNQKQICMRKCSLDLDKGLYLDAIQALTSKATLSRGLKSECDQLINNWRLVMDSDTQHTSLELNICDGIRWFFGSASSLFLNASIRISKIAQKEDFKAWQGVSPILAS